MWLKNQVKCSPCSQESKIKQANKLLLTDISNAQANCLHVLITGQQEHITKKTGLPLYA